MSPRLSRRSALQISSTALTLGIAGCTDAVPSDSDSPPAASSNIPTPNEDCQVTSLPSAQYPSIPDSLTETTANDFALDFEAVYASASLESEGYEVASSPDGQDATVTQTADSGYVVEVFLAVDFTEETATATTDAGSASFNGWYYVTESFAMRAAGDGAEDRPTSGWETVACE